MNLLVVLYHTATFIIDSLVTAFSNLSLSDDPIPTGFFDVDMTYSTHSTQTQISELWITYNQASRMHEQATTQFVDVGNAVHLFDLEDVLDHLFEQGFLDPKLRSGVWWEDCTSVRLKATTTVQDLLARGAGSTPETALRLVIDVPTAIWVLYEYANGVHPHTVTQRFIIDSPHLKCERLTHLTDYIFAKGYLPCKARPLVSWKGACGKHVNENAKIEDVLSWGEGLCEEKPLRLVIDL